jgi:hypothetical protein
VSTWPAPPSEAALHGVAGERRLIIEPECAWTCRSGGRLQGEELRRVRQATPDRAAVRQRASPADVRPPAARERWIEGLRPAASRRTLCASRAAWRRDRKNRPGDTSRDTSGPLKRASRRSRRCATCRPPRSTTQQVFPSMSPSRAKKGRSVEPAYSVLFHAPTPRVVVYMSTTAIASVYGHLRALGEHSATL